MVQELLAQSSSSFALFTQPLITCYVCLIYHDLELLIDFANGIKINFCGKIDVYLAKIVIKL